MSLWATALPGVVQDSPVQSLWNVAKVTYPFSLALVGLPILAVLAASLAVAPRFAWAQPSDTRPIMRWNKWAIAEAIAIPVVIYFTAALIATGAPKQIAFMFSHGAFDEVVEWAPVSQDSWPLNQRLGLYYVHSFATDPRGGTYFRIRSDSHWASHGITTHGLVKDPNDEGTPYGFADYELTPIAGGWCWFEASRGSS